MVPLIAAAAFALGSPDPEPGTATERQCEPVRFSFAGHCAPSRDNQPAYDPRSRTYHINMSRLGSSFTVRSVVPDIVDRQVVLRIAHIKKNEDKPLKLYVPVRGKEEPLEFVLSPQRHDKKLFRVQWNGDLLTVEFTDNGKQLLQPETCFYYFAGDRYTRVEKQPRTLADYIPKLH